MWVSTTVWFPDNNKIKNIYVGDMTLFSIECSAG